MTVFRIKKTENFVTIHKGALENPNLSFKSKGLWAYCMTRPNDWVFHVNHLATVSKEGKDAIYSAIRELQSEGYIKKVQKNINGEFQKVDYEVYEIQIILPQTDFPQTENPQTENPPLLSIDPLLNIESNKEGKGADKPPSVGPPPKKNLKEEALERAERVFTTDSQHQSLMKKAQGNENLTQAWYNRLSQWKIGKGLTGGKSDYLAILKWVVEATAQDSVPSTPPVHPDDSYNPSAVFTQKPEPALPKAPQELDMEWLDKYLIDNGYVDYQRLEKIKLLDRYVEFPELRDEQRVWYGDAGFKARIECNLRKVTPPPKFPNARDYD